MKSFLVIALFFASAHASADMDRSYICISGEIDKTVVLTQLTDFQSIDDENADWEAEARYSVSLQTTELPFPGFTSEGVAYTFDVMYQFQAENLYEGQSVTFNMYLDELDQSKLYIGGSEYNYTCQTMSEAFGRE